MEATKAHWLGVSLSNTHPYFCDVPQSFEGEPFGGQIRDLLYSTATEAFRSWSHCSVNRILG